MRHLDHYYYRSNRALVKVPLAGEIASSGVGLAAGEMLHGVILLTAA